MRILLSAVLVAGGAIAAETNAAIQERAAKATVLLQRVAAEWKTPCLSCHHQVMPMIALDSARRHGVAVDEAKAQAAAERTFRAHTDVDAAARVDMLIDPAVSTGYELLAAHAAGQRPNLSTALLARHVARTQRFDGSWPIFDARPPHSAGLFLATAVAARAVDLYLPPGQAKTEIASRARRWLSTAKPQSTEDLTYRLLGLLWTGGDDQAIRKSAADLASAQRADGGWAQEQSIQASDAYSTAQAVVALRRSGKASAASLERGVEWLAREQKADGSWHVTSRLNSPAPLSPPYFESGFPYKHDQWISCAATAWGVMAMAESLPKAATPAIALPLRGTTPKTAPWMETAAFGSAVEVAKLDPKLATAGGTTVLMLAADDPLKVKVLLDRGADANARAKSGYDALMIASIYGGNAATLDLLLKAGASPKPRPGVRFEASALNLAFIAGDAAMAELLIRNGADPNQRFRMIGQVLTSPLNYAALAENVPLVRVLVKAGARMDVPDNDGMTDLSWAALGHKNEAVRVLLELGAKPDTKDRFGLTPLAHTKGISHLDSTAEELIRARLAR